MHPYKYDSDAPFWVSKDKIPPKKYSKERVYKPLTEDMVQRFVRKAVKKASINKRVYPHLFRHTCAAELAKDWTEPMLRAFLGWEPPAKLHFIPMDFTKESLVTALTSSSSYYITSPGFLGGE